MRFLIIPARAKIDISSGSATWGEGDGLDPERHAISKAMDRQECGKLLKWRISNVPGSLQEQFGFTGV